MAAGGSFGDAAGYLGYPTGTVEGRRIVHTPTRKAIARDRDAFARAVRAMAEDLARGPLIDYHRRRLALRDWELDHDAWEAIHTAVLAIPRRLRTSWYPNEVNRQLASMAVWYHVTHGEMRLSPRPIQDRQPPTVRRSWTDSRVSWDKWIYLIRSSPSQLYTALREQIEAYANEFAACIDAGNDSYRLAKTRAQRQAPS